MLFGDYPNAIALLLSHTNIYLNKYSNDHLKIMVNITKHNQTSHWSETFCAYEETVVECRTCVGKDGPDEWKHNNWKEKHL